ncbi:UNVERIFIED_CONTAM: putative late blight resistance proteinR1A-10, partial [Sesamum angustifolium]
TLLKEEIESEMATAYAALVSLMHILEQIQHHPRPPVSLDKEQVQSLQENVVVLQDFLELYSNRQSQEYEGGLVVRIAGAAHAAEDVIENHLVDQILDQSTSTSGENISSIDHHFYQDLQKIIADIDLIKKEVIETKEKMGIVQDRQLHGNSISSGSLSSAALHGHKQVMVGRDHVLNDIMDKLTGQQSDCRIIPIVGMGVSQEYKVREMLLELVCQKNKEKKKALREISDEGLGEMLYKSLSGRRYLIIMDDVWSIEAWDKWLSWPCDEFSGGEQKLGFFCKTVFGEEGNCPLELEEIGKTIAKNCKGLPLSVIMIGGLLAKSEKTLDYWEYIAGNLSSIVNFEDNERCLRILYTSYQELPIHLKPCFLYMGVHPEDSRIRVSRLINLWVAEGFLKPISGKSLEEVAGDYLNDLIDRNLIIVDRLGSSGKIGLCKMHDLLRDLCLREAQRQKFLSSLEIGEAITIHRRIVVRQNSPMEKYDISKVSHSVQLARSLTSDFQEALPLASFRLLRVLKKTDSEDLYGLKGDDRDPIEVILKLVNSRYLALYADTNLNSTLPSSMHLLWNLQTLIIKGIGWPCIYAPPEIWKMHHLRRVRITGLNLPDPPTVDEFVTLPNLQKMAVLMNFKCSETVVKRIPNIKKLHVFYDVFSSSHYCLENLGHLQTLESLNCSFGCSVRKSYLVDSLSILHSLKKLTLWGCRLQWEDITRNIGSLPLLHVLKLYYGSVIGPEWETVEGQFCCLRFLEIVAIDDLEHWTTAESSHFPRLNCLRLLRLRKLKDIPSSFGEIQTLEVIELEMCSDSVVISAKEIAEQQEEFGNPDFRVTVRAKLNSKLEPELKSLATQHKANSLELLSEERQSSILKEQCESDMATAYAALVSLVHTIEQIQHHPRPPISLDKQQLQSLQEQVAFLQDSLELYSHRLIIQEYEGGLVIRIADAAHAAEDVIESHIVDQILDQSTSSSGENISFVHNHFYQDLQKVIADMDLIKNEVTEIKKRIVIVQDRELYRNSVPAGSLSSSLLTGQKHAMVGVDDVLNDIMDKLTGQQSGCRIIPIVGMGGIGKTALARNVYENPLIVQYFDTCAWVTVSQEYNTREILLELVCPESKESKEMLSGEELGENVV